MFPSLACSLPADAIRRTAKLENSIGDFPDEIKPPHGFTLYKIISAAGAYAAQGYAASLSQPQRLFLKPVVTAVPPYPSSEIKKEAYSCLKHSCGILFNCAAALIWPVKSQPFSLPCSMCAGRSPWPSVHFHGSRPPDNPCCQSTGGIFPESAPTPLQRSGPQPP